MPVFDDTAAGGDFCCGGTLLTVNESCHPPLDAGKWWMVTGRNGDDSVALVVRNGERTAALDACTSSGTDQTM